jgi:uncharacterized protein (UPF0147 family)
MLRSAAVGAVLLLAMVASADPKVDRLLDQLADPNPDVREEAADRLTMLPATKSAVLQQRLKENKLPANVRPQVEAAIEAIDARVEREAIRRRIVRPQLAWWEAQTVDAYAQFGRKDPKWEKRESDGLPNFQWANAGGQFRQFDQYQNTWNCLNAAIKRGCDDPLIGYVYGRVEVRVDGKPDLEPLLAAARNIGASRYSPYMKCACLVFAANWSLHKSIPQTDELKRERNQWVAAALQLLPEVVKDEKLPRGVLLELMADFGHASFSVEDDRAIYFNQAFAVLEKAGVPRAVLLSARAEMNTDYAWDARGGGWAHTVKEGGWEKFGQRLQLAADDAAEAWKLDQTIGETARTMLMICIGQGRPRDEMELWFERAMEIDPDDLTACRRKLMYLRPRWHGTHQEQLAFGRECLGSGNFEGGLPLILIEAHFNVGTDTDDPEKYYRSGPQVWADARAVLLPLMRRHPQSRDVRSRYLWFAATCEKWDEVQRVLPLFEGKWDYSYSVFSQKEFDELKEKAAEHAATTRPSTRPG